MQYVRDNIATFINLSERFVPQDIPSEQRIIVY